jgi:hypothetical protein
MSYFQIYKKQNFLKKSKKKKKSNLVLFIYFYKSYLFFFFSDIKVNINLRRFKYRSFL